MTRWSDKYYRGIDLEPTHYLAVPESKTLIFRRKTRRSLERNRLRSRRDEFLQTKIRVL